MERPYKLFATDMDGTLLNSKKEISEGNLKAMRDLNKQGIEVAICTGRPFFTVNKYLEKLGFPCWIVSNNGSVIRNKNREILSVIYIKQEILQQIINLLEQEDIYYHMGDVKCNYIQSSSERIKRLRDYMIRAKKSKFKTLWHPIYVVLFSRTHKKVNYNSFIQSGGKVASIFVICDNSEKISRIKEKLINIKGIDISSSGKNNIEILDKRATKGHSLKKIASILKISLNKVVAVGDNYNDLTMIQYAGLGVAMENSGEEIKKNADWITKSNEEDGVANLIYEKIIPPKETIPKRPV